MKKSLFLIKLLFVLILVSGNARAQDGTLNIPDAFSDVLTVCNIIQLSQNPELMKDVTVNGESVVPADINDHSDMIPEELTFPVSIDLNKLADNPGKPVEMLGEAGTLVVNTKSGKVKFNGKDISGSVDEICLTSSFAE